MATKANLLVVDDELIVRDSLDKWFREEGYDVAVADSAHDALAKMAAKRFDLALVDIKMPGTDGVELQRRMHEIDPDMLVIIMTGYASVETAVAALKNGAYDYVSKPFDPDDIAHTVHNALSHQRAQIGKCAPARDCRLGSPAAGNRWSKCRNGPRLRSHPDRRPHRSYRADHR